MSLQNPQGSPKNVPKNPPRAAESHCPESKKNVYAVDVSNPSKTIPKESPNKLPKSSRVAQERAEKRPTGHQKPLPRQQIKRLRRRRFESIHNDAQGVPKQPPKSPWVAQERAQNYPRVTPKTIISTSLEPTFNST